MSIDIVIGSNETTTTALESNEKILKVSLDTDEKVILVLGINKVTVEHINGSWTIVHNSNVVAQQVPVKQDNLMPQRCDPGYSGYWDTLREMS